MIQELKKNIVFKIFERCTNANLNNIIFEKNRVCAKKLFHSELTKEKTKQ